MWEQGNQDKTPAEIAEDIKSGRYFSEALGWYNSVFVGALKTPAAMLVFACVAVFTAGVMGIYLYQAFPLTEKVTVVVPMVNTAQFYPRLVQLKSNAPTKQLVAEHLCARYVIAREAYAEDRMKPHYAFILRSSSKTIFDKYYALLTAIGSANPTSIRKLHQTRKIKILSKLSDSGSQKDGNKVIILFEKNIYDGSGQFVSTSKWRADIEFYMSDYDWATAKTAKLDFIVTNYTTNELKDAPVPIKIENANRRNQN